MSYTEIQNLPTVYRRWFIDKIINEHEEKLKSQDNNGLNDKNAREIIEDTPMGLLAKESKHEKSF